MSRRRAGLSPSLFPFLAVLVCTLGTLILLLALVAQEAQDAAVAHAEQIRREKLAPTSDAIVRSQQPNLGENDGQPTDAPENALEAPGPTALTADAAKRLINEEQFRVEQLISFRDAQTQDAEKKRNEIAQIEAAIRKQKERLESLSREVEAATTEQDPTEILKVDESTLVMMEEEIEKLRAEIKELESSERGKKPRVVIVPHRGPNGTQRRPVYVECTGDEIRILPEGARITKTQALAAAESRNPNANPLGSALRVARRHAMQSYGDAVAPYPLLIVRPGGIRMFRLASALMKDWDDQYGYELVPGEVDLAFPGGDSVLKKELDYAIHEASSRNFMLARGGGGGRGNGGGGGGSFGFQDGSPNANPNGGPSNFSGVGPSNGEASGTSSPRENQFASGGRNDGDQSRNGVQAKKPLPVLSAKSLDQQGLKNGFAPARDQRFGNAMGGFQPPPSSTGQSYGPNGATSNLRTDALSDFLKAKTSADTGSNNDGPTGGGFGGTGSPGNESMPQGQPGTNASDLANSNNQTAPNGQTASSNQTAINGQTAQNSQPIQPGQTPPPGGNSAAPSANASANSSPTMQPPSASNAGGSGSPPPDQPSSSQTPSMPSMQAPPQEMVRRGGRDWAMPEAFRGMGGTEVVRPISMICHHDRYELIDQGRVVASFPFQHGDVYQSTMQLATAIRDRVSNWGATLPGGRWQPRLEVQVGPHGEQRFHELETLMQGSGIEIKRRLP